MKFWKCGKLLLSDSEGGCGLGGLGGLLGPVGDRGGGGAVAGCVGDGGGLAGCGTGSGGLVDGERDGCGSKERGASCKKDSGWVGTGKRGGKVGGWEAEMVGNVRGSNNSGC